jgi:UDP-glucose 4-epimerase
MRSAIERKPMTIFGDGTQTRDFLHVDSLVEANMLALDKNDAIGEAFNIGSGISTSIIELSEMVREISGADAPVPIYLPQREGDIKHSLSDITKARNILGYKPRVDLRSDLKNLFGILTKH